MTHNFDTATNNTNTQRTTQQPAFPWATGPRQQQGHTEHRGAITWYCRTQGTKRKGLYATRYPTLIPAAAPRVINTINIDLQTHLRGKRKRAHLVLGSDGN